LNWTVLIDAPAAPNCRVFPDRFAVWCTEATELAPIKVDWEVVSDLQME